MQGGSGTLSQTGIGEGKLSTKKECFKKDWPRGRALERAWEAALWAKVGEGGMRRKIDALGGTDTK